MYTHGRMGQYFPLRKGTHVDDLNTRLEAATDRADRAEKEVERLERRVEE